MKKISLIAASCLLLCVYTRAQNLGINTDGSKPDANAILDVKSNNKGILIPRMSTTARLAIPPTKGLLVYDSTTQSFWYNTGIEWKSIAVSSALASTDAWLLTGNSGTDSTNFLGTTDNVPLHFRVNNRPSGLIDHIMDNTLYGFATGIFNTTGRENTAVGSRAMARNTTGFANTATGFQSMLSNTTGSSNTASGWGSLGDNTTGVENVALGGEAMRRNTNGRRNTAIGHIALFSNTLGRFNTAGGASALFGNIDGNFNTAFGTFSMLANTSGTSNSALGNRSLTNNTSGSSNVAVGEFSLKSNFSGSFNTAIGYNADVSISDLTNATAVGNGAIVDASNKVRIGNSAVTVIEGQVPFTTPSDGRYKFNVQEDVKGLDFIMQLRPVTYQFDVKRFDTQLGRQINNEQAYNDAEMLRRTGFIAQEVEQAANATGYNFSGVIKPKKDNDHYSLSYDAFVVPLVKAVQEQQQVIDAQNKKIAGLQQQLDEIKKMLQQKK